MRKVFGIGETILDIIFRNDQPQQAIPGGSVFNGLISLGRLNVPVSFISEVGNDRVGDLILKFMEENHVCSELVNRFPNGKSPVSLAFLDNDRNADYLFYKDYSSQRLDGPLPDIKEDDILIFGSYFSVNPVLRSRVIDVLQLAKDRNAIIYYDPNFRKTHAHEAIRLMPTVLENLEFADIVRGSDEDFMNLFGKADTENVYKEHIQFYCDRFITTHGANGINLYTRDFIKHYDSKPIEPLSTIGAGDSFNAGVLFGLLKHDIRHADLASLTEEKWDQIIRCGMDLATEVCQSYDNYISKEFAASYVSHS